MSSTGEPCPKPGSSFSVEMESDEFWYAKAFERAEQDKTSTQHLIRSKWDQRYPRVTTGLKEGEVIVWVDYRIPGIPRGGGAYGIVLKNHPGGGCEQLPEPVNMIR